MIKKECGLLYTRKMKIQTRTREKILLKFHIGQLLNLTTFSVMLLHHLLWDSLIYYSSLAQEDGPRSMRTKIGLGDEEKDSCMLIFDILTTNMHLYYLSFCIYFKYILLNN